MKYSQTEKDLSFPIHHKQKREHSITSVHELDEIDTLDIPKLISNAYDQAVDIVKNFKIVHILNQHKISCLSDLSNFIFDLLSKNSRMANYSFRAENSIVEEYGLDEENDDNDVTNDASGPSIDELLFDSPGYADSDDDESMLNSTRSDFSGIRIMDSINPALRQSYFKVKINDRVKYLHKQSGCWLHSNNVIKLSSDRLSRVMQTTCENN